MKVVSILFSDNLFGIYSLLNFGFVYFPNYPFSKNILEFWRGNFLCPSTPSPQSSPHPPNTLTLGITFTLSWASEAGNFQRRLRELGARYPSHFKRLMWLTSWNMAAGIIRRIYGFWQFQFIWTKLFCNLFSPWKRASWFWIFFFLKLSSVLYWTLE